MSGHLNVRRKWTLFLLVASTIVYSGITKCHCVVIIISVVCILTVLHFWFIVT